MNTDNNIVNEAIVYLSAIGFFIVVFPIHVFNYAYISTAQKYASVNVNLFRLIPVFNVNTVKNSLSKVNVNGKEKKMNSSFVSKNALKIFNNLCITKIVQLSDFGLLNETNVYIAYAQNCLTQAIYAFVRINGGKVKLRNYTLLNYEHENVTYYLKLVGVINLLTVGKIFAILLWEKINEHKNQKNTKRHAV